MNLSYNIYDLARDAGVSVATVSRVINNSGSVKEATREKIMELIRINNYAPNVFARGLNNVGMKTIGVLISDIANPFFAQVVKGIDSICQQTGYKLILCSTENDHNKEKNEIKMLIAKHVEGFILVGSRECRDYNSSFLIELSNNCPVVLVNSFIKGGDKLFSVLVDEEKAAFDAVSYLVAKRHRSIYILGDTRWKTTANKIEGYERCLRLSKIPFDSSMIINCDHSYYGGVEAAKYVLEGKDKFPCAFFCTSDMIAIGLMRELLKNNISIPGSAAIMGFSNMEVSSLMTPSLTTVDQKMYNLGQQGGKVFLDVLQGKYTGDKKIYMDYEIISNESA